jgi:hypothetical protein
MANTSKSEESDELKTSKTAPELPDETVLSPDSPKQETSTEEVVSKTDDIKTDTAVDEIMKSDSDAVLEAQDEQAEREAATEPQGKWQRFKAWSKAWWASPKKRWTTIGGLVVVVAVVFAVPLTRYNILGLVLKSAVTVQVVDSKTGKPVSGAKVELSGKTAESQADGKATLRTNMGSGDLKVSKKYYTGYAHGELVQSGKNMFKATLVATGRQVSIKLVNKVTGKPVNSATVTAGGAKAKTDQDGRATLVIASDVTTQAATVSKDGFNDATITVAAGDNLAKNTFRVTPAGKLYFLSNLSGTIDVVKTNLDGTDRQTVLAGTGSEDRNSTSLLASRDWKYLALLSKRSGTNASVYLIDTTNKDKLTTIDEGNAGFSLVGWSGDRFVYRVDRNGVEDWQANKQALKSFDPSNGHTLLLDQTQGAGSSNFNYVRQAISYTYLMGGQVVYIKNWSGFGNNPLGGKAAEVHTIGADGSGHRIVKSFAADDAGYGYTGTAVNAALYEPNGLYLAVSHSNNIQEFFDYDDGKVAADTDLDITKFYDSQYSKTYLLSPSSNKTFWADSRDGKQVLSIGDQDAKLPKQVMGLSDYNAYGWYTDDYVLVSKSGSELYVMGKDGGTPLKITDYYKPSISYQGYGGGYGGL